MNLVVKTIAVTYFAILFKHTIRVPESDLHESWQCVMNVSKPFRTGRYHVTTDDKILRENRVAESSRSVRGIPSDRFWKPDHDIQSRSY